MEAGVERVALGSGMGGACLHGDAVVCIPSIDRARAATASKADPRRRPRPRARKSLPGCGAARKSVPAGPIQPPGVRCWRGSTLNSPPSKARTVLNKSLARSASSASSSHSA